MSFPIWKLQLPELEISELDALKQLAEEWARETNNSSLSTSLPHNLPAAKPPRRIDAIFADVMAERFNQLTLLEWIYCLFAKTRWDQQHPDQAEPTALAIWRAATENEWLKRCLLWRIALYYGNQQFNALPASVAELLLSNETIALISNDQLLLQVLTLFRHKRFEDLAALSLQHLLTPGELLEKLHLPNQIDAVNKALDFVSCQFSQLSLVESSRLKWLLRCLTQMTRSQQLTSVEYLLLHLSKEASDTYSPLVRWVKQRYAPTQTNSRWNELSHQAKVALRHWIGAANYADFQRLVDLVLKQFNLDDKEIRQLKSRREFWSNYSDRFDQIRILLPESSAAGLKKHFLQSDVGILREDGSDPTEVCIFDFGEWYVIEFFRGRGSETRLLNRKQHSGLEEKLFHSSNLSAKCFRCLGGETFDHVYLWQIFCERWLRERGIYPNEGLRLFRRVDASDAYDSKLGLPLPSRENRQKRENSLYSWRQRLQEFEREVRFNCCNRWNT